MEDYFGGSRGSGATPADPRAPNGNVEELDQQGPSEDIDMIE
jgi:hypothetical protein